MPCCSHSVSGQLLTAQHPAGTCATSHRQGEDVGGLIFWKVSSLSALCSSYITNTPWNINSTAFLFMLFVPAAPQKVPDRTSTLTAPSSLVWRDLVKSESSYSINRKRFELETSDSSHLGSTYVPYHLADLMDELLEKTGWGGTNCSYLPFAASRACSLQHSFMCTVST